MSDQREQQQGTEAIWNAELYDSKHSFVWEYGGDLISLLAPKPGEHILDIGCGTGHLTAKIAESGAHIVGVDRQLTMITAARQAYPDLRFEVADARKLPFEETFDAVFSNAALHWIHEPQLVIRNIWKVLRPQGRFVAELGGKGNVHQVKCAMDQALAELRGPGCQEINPWYFPSVSEYASLLETNGFVVRFITLFDRPTPLADGEAGLRTWITMFCAGYLEALQPEFRESFLRRVADLLRAELFRDGQWCADYRRLRVMALK